MKANQDGGKKFVRDVISGGLAIALGSAICFGANWCRQTTAQQAQVNERLARIESKLGIETTTLAKN